MNALIIVDMQNGCFENNNRFKQDEVIGHINSLIQTFRKNDAPVIFIQHEEEVPEFTPGSEGWQLLASLNQQEQDLVVSKTCCDAFIETPLAEILKARNISRVFICGCATDFCVDSTIKGAIAQQLDVVIASDAHTTSDRPFANAKQLIDHFNWNWANLITGESTLKVLETKEIMTVKGL